MFRAVGLGLVHRDLIMKPGHDEYNEYNAVNRTFPRGLG